MPNPRRAGDWGGCSGVVSRVAYRAWRSVRNFNKEITLSFLLFLQLKMLGPELGDSITSAVTADASLNCYVVSSQVADSLRSTAQVAYFIERAKVGRRIEDPADQWLTAIFSTFIILKCSKRRQSLKKRGKRWRTSATRSPRIFPPRRQQQPNIRRRTQVITVVRRRRRRKRSRKRKSRAEDGYVPNIPVKERCTVGGAVFLTSSLTSLLQPQSLANPPDKQHQHDTVALLETPEEEESIRGGFIEQNTSNFGFPSTAESGRKEETYIVIIVIPGTFQKQQRPDMLTTPTLPHKPNSNSNGVPILLPVLDMPEDLQPPKVIYVTYSESKEIIRPEQASVMTKGVLLLPDNVELPTHVQSPTK